MRLVSLLIVLCTLAGTVASEETQASAERGKALANACLACHTLEGQGTAPLFPHLGGQGTGYVYQQLLAIRDGTRSVPEMTGQLNNLSDSDLRSLAMHYDNQPPRSGASDPKLFELGRKIYKGGDHKRQIPACSACHSPTGAGNPAAKFPLLGGQSATYIAKALRDYRYERRTTDGDVKIMRTISTKLTEAEVDAVASYIEGLSP